MNIEPLEPRIAPATLLNPHTVSYIDPDGDHVLIKTTKGAWDLAADFHFVASAGGERLDYIYVGENRQFSGAKISVMASGAGDGNANVGAIYAQNVDLAAITVDGDLGRVIAGDGFVSTPGLGALSAASLGALGGSSLGIFVEGKLGKLTIAGNVENGASIVADSIGSVLIGGDLRATSADYQGYILAEDGDIGSVQIVGQLLGGAGKTSGSITSSAGSIGSVTIGGDVTGSGELSGVISADRGIGTVKIGGDLKGGSGMSSGRIFAEDRIGSIVLGGGIQGGDGEASGSIACNGPIGSVQTGTKTDGSVVGGSKNQSGTIQAAGDVGKIIIGGDLQGGSHMGSGIVDITGGRLGLLSIARDCAGGYNPNQDGDFEYLIHAAEIGTIKIGGDFRAGNRIGEISSDHAIASLIVGGGIYGSGSIPAVIKAFGAAQPGEHTDLAIGKISVGTDLIEARILAGAFSSGNSDAQIGSILIKGDVLRSSIAAGVSTGGDTFFGDTNDTLADPSRDRPEVVAKIASIVVGGTVEGSGTVTNDHFGFVANQIGLLHIHGLAVSLKAGASNDQPPRQIAATTGDVFVLEV